VLTSTTTTALPPRRFRSGRVKLGAAAGGVLIAVCAGAGAAVWQLHSSGSRGHAVTRTIAPQPAAAAPASSAAAVLYLVGSPEQAAELQQGLDWATTAGSPVQATVRQVASDAEADAARQEVAAENGFVAGAGLPPIQVIDMRSAANGASVPATPQNGVAAHLGNQQPAAVAAPQVILVSSAEQADRIEAELSAADPLTAAGGTSSTVPQIVVVDPSQAAQTLQSFADANQLRASLGLSEIVVTDLTQSE